jgi:hypothetical protein
MCTGKFHIKIHVTLTNPLDLWSETCPESIPGSGLVTWIEKNKDQIWH